MNKSWETYLSVLALSMSETQNRIIWSYITIHKEMTHRTGSRIPIHEETSPSGELLWTSVDLKLFCLFKIGLLFLMWEMLACIFTLLYVRSCSCIVQTIQTRLNSLSSILVCFHLLEGVSIAFSAFSRSPMFIWSHIHITKTALLCKSLYINKMKTAMHFPCRDLC